MASLRIRGAIERSAPVTLTVDGEAIAAEAGESVATALLAAGFRRLGQSFHTGTPRGAFCLMGLCQECLVLVDGVPMQACVTPVRDGMAIVLERM